jgi:hypothetical protein
VRSGGGREGLDPQADKRTILDAEDGLTRKPPAAPPPHSCSKYEVDICRRIHSVLHRHLSRKPKWSDLVVKKKRSNKRPTLERSFRKSGRDGTGKGGQLRSEETNPIGVFVVDCTRTRGGGGVSKKYKKEKLPWGFGR